MDYREFKKLITKATPEQLAYMPAAEALEMIRISNSPDRGQAITEAKLKALLLEEQYNQGLMTPKDLAHETALVWMEAEIKLTDWLK